MNNNILQQYQFWTTEEETLLRKLSGSMSFKEMQTIHFPNKSPVSLQKKALKLKLISGYKHTEYSHNKDFWKNPNLINAYVAGFCAADSNLNKFKNCFRLQIQERDRHHLELFKNLMGFTGDLHVYNGYPSLDIAGCGEWYKDLKEIWSITPNKTFTLQPPKIYDDNLIKAFLGGNLDGDGWLSHRKEGRRMRMGFVCASLPFLEWAKQNLERIFPFFEKTGQVAPKSSNIVKSPKYNYWSLHIDGLRAIRTFYYLREFIKANNIPALSRKWDNPKLLEQVELDKQKYPHLFLPIPSQVSVKPNEL